MNIQIFGKQKCFDTKKAERWFKERRIKFQYSWSSWINTRCHAGNLTVYPAHLAAMNS